MQIEQIRIRRVRALRDRGDHLVAPGGPLPQAAWDAGVRAYTFVVTGNYQIWAFVRNGVIRDAGVNLPGAWR